MQLRFRTPTGNIDVYDTHVTKRCDCRSKNNTFMLIICCVGLQGVKDYENVDIKKVPMKCRCHFSKMVEFMFSSEYE